MDKAPQARLDALAQHIIESDVCPQLRGQAIQLVMGSGNPEAEVVFIGEAPGKNEDIQGVPFVGAAGKFLDSMLADVGLSRSDVYITNTVKYRPPNNRDPKPEEKAAFLPYLLQELEIINPKAIVALGRHSMNTFLPGASISELHGEPVNITLDNGQAVTLIPLYHPAAALYNGGLRQTLQDDFAKMIAIVRGQ